MEEIHEPHDGLFKLVFSNIEHARAELLSVLPSELLAAVDLGTLELRPGCFVDEKYKKMFTDLLFSVSVGGEQGLVYFLLEHQSTNDRWMPLRLWAYLGQIWQWFVKNTSEAVKLPLIIPVVIHHSKTGWQAASNIDERVETPAAVRDVLTDKLPRLGYFLDDLTVQEDEALRARSMAALPRVVLWAMKNARHVKGFIHWMREWGQLFREVAQAHNGVHSFIILMSYILQVSDATPQQIEQFSKELGPLASEAYMTGAQILHQEDRRSILVELLEKKFGDVPAPALQRIEQAGPDQLRGWLMRLLEAESVDEVLEEPTHEDHPAA